MIKLCVIPNDVEQEIELFQVQPLIENIDKNILLFENYPYKIVVKCDVAYDNLELFIGDYQIPLSIDDITGNHETPKDFLFNGCFDLVDITVCTTDLDGTETYWYTNYLRIATTKQTAQQVEIMLKEIEDSLPNFLDICFSRSKKKSGLKKSDIRSIWNTFKLLDEIIDVYEHNYGSFKNYRRAKVVDIPTIVDAKSMRRIDQEGLQWISRNPDYLRVSEKKTGIKIGELNYLPLKVKTYTSEYSYELYENKVVLGFLKAILNYIDCQIFEFNKEIDLVKNIPHEIVRQLPNTHELTGRCIYIYYQGVIEKFKEKEGLILDLFYRYSQLLMCNPADISYVPELTNIFRQVYHYQACYECIAKWYETGDYSFDHLNYLFKLKTLTRIFEYYCLIKFQNSILLYGYELKNASRIQYKDIENESEEINNKYVFSNGKYELSLFYEPYIQVSKVYDEINLYSTGYNFSKAKWNDGWTPDFVFKISGEENEYYFIIDAKYSNFNNVRRRHIPELVLKYSTQIASCNKYTSDVIGIGAIYPNDNNRMYYYKKESKISTKKSIPMFFSLSVEEGDIGNIALKDRLSELLEIVEILENNELQTDIGVKTISEVKMVKKELVDSEGGET